MQITQSDGTYQNLLLEKIFFSDLSAKLAIQKSLKRSDYSLVDSSTSRNSFNILVYFI